MTVKELYERGLTPRVLVLGLMFLFVFGSLSILVSHLGQKPDSLPTFVIPFFWIILLNTLMGRISSRWKLSRAELLIFFLVPYLIFGRPYIVTGTTNENMVQQALTGFFSTTYLVANPPYAEVVRQLLPSYIHPTSPDLISAIWDGLSPGENIQWGEWFGAVAYWSLHYIVWAMLVIFMTFALIGPQWTEVEALPFPLAQPTTYLISESDALFERVREHKVFWIFFAIGFILALIPIIGEYILLVPVVWEWVEIPVEFPWLASLLPGCLSGAQIITAQIFLWMLVPNDVMYTSIFFFVIFGLIFWPLGVKLGFVPYEPGIESWANWYYGYRPPFPSSLYANGGVAIGVALWSLWLMRNRIKNCASALFSSKSGENEEPSQRFLTIGLILSCLAFIIFFSATGLPVIISIILLIHYFLWRIVQARVWTEVWYHDPVYWMNGWLWTYPVGLSLGYWTADVPTTSSAWLIYNINADALSSWMPRHNASGGGIVQWYYMARQLKVRIKDCFIAAILFTVIGVVFFTIANIWFAHHIGFANSSIAGDAGYYGGTDAARYVTSTEEMAPGYSFSQEYYWLFAGILTAIILYILRMRFGWFFINPTAMVPALWLMEWMWLNAIIALVIKVIFIRIFGLKRFAENARAAASGICLGYGAPIIIAVVLNFMTVVLPGLQLYYR